MDKPFIEPEVGGITQQVMRIREAFNEIHRITVYDPEDSLNLEMNFEQAFKSIADLLDTFIKKWNKTYKQGDE